MDDDVTRRVFLAGAAALGVAGVTGLAACSSDDDGSASGGDGDKPTTTASQRQALPDPSDAPFDTVVVVMMENRSFDALLGWLPGADGKQAGLSYKDAEGKEHETWGLAD